MRVAWVEAKEIQGLVSELSLKQGPDLCDTHSSLALSGTIAEVCNVTTTVMFTEEEADECVVTALTTTTTYPVLSRTYGMVVITIARYVKKVQTFVDSLARSRATAARDLVQNPVGMRQAWRLCEMKALSIRWTGHGSLGLTRMEERKHSKVQSLQ